MLEVMQQNIPPLKKVNSDSNVFHGNSPGSDPEEIVRENVPV